MELKGYQEAALKTFDEWWKTLLEKHVESVKLLEEYKTANLPPPDRMQNYPRRAWKAITRNGDASKSTYVDRTDKAGRHIPHVCIKIPTGGGKTLVASAVLERLSLKSGLALWVVPTRRIYEQTKDSLRRRDSPIRQRLDRGGGGRVKFMEKDDALNKNDVEQHLCVMPLMLAAVNRSKNKDFLLMHRDSGRYRSFFPDVDDDARTKELQKKYPELECHKNGTVVRSLANVLRMLRPIIVLDEAHKAYGRRRQEYAEMISQLSPKLVMELSATPNPTISNLLVDVSGKDLWSEEMIKMPINLYVRTDQDWQNVLHMVYDKREQLEGDAKLFQSKTGRYIRPIALVRVERTGKNQRDGRFIHADDVKDYLIKKCAVSPTHIAVQSSSQRDLEGIDLLSEATEIRWIITKDAIKEGWDCPFAYVLAILDNIKTHTSVTQLLGRVLRQPEAQRTEVDNLDMCYVYCQSGDTGKVVKYVKKGLAKEGMADVNTMVLPDDVAKTAVRIKKRQRPGGRIFLPMVLHKDGDSWANLQYDRHILSNVDFAAVRAPDPASFIPTPHGWYKFLIDPGGTPVTPSPLEAHGYKAVKVSDFARPLSDVVPNIWQAARIAQDFIERLIRLGNTRDDIYNGLHYLVRILCDDVRRSINRQAEEVFRDKLKRGCIRFDLEIEDTQYEIKNYTVTRGTLLQKNGVPVQRSLLEPVFEEEFDTDLERSFAKYLDTKETVVWWHRVAARQRDSYHIVGWKRSRIYPDFIAMANGAGDKVRLGIYDTKGGHLNNNLDTEYKKSVLRTLEGMFNCGTVKVHGRMHGEFRLVFEDKFEEILVD